MSPRALHQLRSRQHYRVRITGRRTETPTFLSRERRFHTIPCPVLSSPVRGPLTVKIIKPGHVRITAPPHRDQNSASPMTI